MDARTLKVIHWEVSNLTDSRSTPVLEAIGKQYKLTPREKEVFQLLVMFGFRNEDLSRILYISPKTVKNHLACLMQKTNTRSSRELQAMFLRAVLDNLQPVSDL